MAESTRGGGLSPMLCQSAEEPPRGDRWTFEPKYDGIRALAYLTPEHAALVTRNGRDKAAQFPEIASVLRNLAADLGVPAVLDGEIVAPADGETGRFEALQPRMHVTSASTIDRLARETPAAFVAFDLLLAGDDVWLHGPWEERRQKLECLLRGRLSDTLRLGETSRDPEALLGRARREGWEGIIAKRIDSPYHPGARSTNWLKVKIEGRQEFVVGGWTEPRKSRKYFGALLLGHYDEAGELVYVGHTGTGFTHRALEDVYRRLQRLERKTSPFSRRPRTNEPAHWATPRIVVEVRFNKWTRDGKLRHPVFLGIREDRDARTVVREADAAGRPHSARPIPPPKTDSSVPRGIRGVRDAGGDGTLHLGEGADIQLTNLGKTFFPEVGLTKGDLLCYYAGMADLILPWMRDRPLVLERYPDGVDGESFYQQSAGDNVPAGVRVETIVSDRGDAQERLVGGDLATLLYTAQLGAISYDPWHSRVGHLHAADYSILDLDPGPGVPFRQVVEAARRVKEAMEEVGVSGAVKTSGSRGLHIYLPLPPDTPLEAATLVAQILATRVANRYPEHATVERMRRKRPSGTVYLDYLQNILGKTVSGVYAVRARPGATVSAPVAWDELTDDLDLREFTLRTMPDRVRSVGDLWAPAMAATNRLDRLVERARA